MHNELPNSLDALSDANACGPATPSTVAEATLRARLDRVSDLLPLAAMQSDCDREHVHQLRIATRQAMAALDAYQEWLDPKSAAWLRKRLKGIRSATGDARDLDVMSTGLHQSASGKHKKLVRHLRRKRQQAQTPLVKIYKRIQRRGDDGNHVERCLESIRQHAIQLSSTWVIRRVQDAAELFFASIPQDAANDESLHRFRIQAKRLRYILELFDAREIQEIKSQLYPTVREIQSALGDLNDHVMAARRLKKMSRRSKSKRLAGQFAKLSKREKRRAGQTRRAFHQHWPVERLMQAKDAFESTRRDLCVCEDRLP